MSCPRDANRIRAERNDGDGSERERQRHERREKVRELVHAGGRRIFLQKKFGAIGERLQQAVRPDAVRTPARLDVRHNLALEPREIRVHRQHDEQQQRYL